VLAYAYSKGIQAHRDIKPGNIMIDLRTHAITVMDFGIAKTVGSSLTHSTVLYTPKYAAPEQLLPSKFGGVVDKRADLYALGVVLYEMLTGKAPFGGETPAEISGEQITSSPPSPSSIRRDIPAPLSQILLKCLQANPSARYQTPEDLLQDLKAGHVRETRQVPVAPRDQVPVTRRDDQATVIGKGAGATTVLSQDTTPTSQRPLLLHREPRILVHQPAQNVRKVIAVYLCLLLLVVLFEPASKSNVVDNYLSPGEAEFRYGVVFCLGSSWQINYHAVRVEILVLTIAAVLAIVSQGLGWWKRVHDWWF